MASDGVWGCYAIFVAHNDDPTGNDKTTPPNPFYIFSCIFVHFEKNMIRFNPLFTWPVVGIGNVLQYSSIPQPSSLEV